MTDSKYQSIALSVSSNNMNCNNIAKFLLKQKVVSNVTPNISIVPYKDDYIIENGCQILLTNFINKKYLEEKVWIPLKNEANLSCAHVVAPGQFSGCIYDFIRKSDCPNKKQILSTII